jgi:WhiB family redox-sensing transcriptional regulator
VFGWWSILVCMFGGEVPYPLFEFDYAFPRGEWLEKAECRGLDVNAFFPPNGVRPKLALRACGNCSVKPECLEWALENNVHFGVWGGLTERQRFDEKRKRRSVMSLGDLIEGNGF